MTVHVLSTAKRLTCRCVRLLHIIRLVLHLALHSNPGLCIYLEAHLLILHAVSDAQLGASDRGRILPKGKSNWQKKAFLLCDVCIAEGAFFPFCAQNAACSEYLAIVKSL